MASMPLRGSSETTKITAALWYSEGREWHFAAYQTDALNGRSQTNNGLGLETGQGWLGRG
jgi:hypothetical protein